MSHRTIRKICPDARVVDFESWRRDFALLDELVRPVVLRVNDERELVTIRPKRAAEILAIKKRRGLPLEDAELVTTSGSLVKNSMKIELAP